MRFKSKLKVKYIKGTKNPKSYKLTQPLIFGDIVVPIGQTTDFASVPKQLHFLYPPQGKYSRSAVVHDYMYRSGKYKRKYADKIFLKAMKVDGVDFFTRNMFYYAVRLFGGKKWD